MTQPLRISPEEAEKSLKLFEAEKSWRKKCRYIAGVDEAGRGPLAGPIVAAAVILPEDLTIPGINDSKVLSPGKREELFGQILERCLAFGIGMRSASFIDKHGIVRATFSAMKMALEMLSLKVSPDFALVDGYPIPGLAIGQEAIVKGDEKLASIACASIVAKVTRDRIMRSYDTLYPGYAFGRHKGYYTREHGLCLETKGPSPIHRYSCDPVRSLGAS